MRSGNLKHTIFFSLTIACYCFTILCHLVNEAEVSILHPVVPVNRALIVCVRASRDGKLMPLTKKSMGLVGGACRWAKCLVCDVAYSCRVAG